MVVIDEQKMNRFLYIDIVKGCSILCIVLMHYEVGVFPVWINTWIGLFMISAFYFTSGWLAGINPKNITVKELAQKRWYSLGKPYIYFSLLILAFDVLLMLLGHYDMKYVAKEIYKTITLRGIGTLWFLPSLLGGEIIFRFLLNKNKWALTLLVLFITLVFLHYYYYWLAIFRNRSEVYQLIDAPLFNLRKILYAWPTIGIAYLIAKHWGHKISYINDNVVFVIGICITGFSIYLNGGFCPLSLGDISPLIVPVIGPLGLLLLAYPMKKGVIAKFFSFWGINSLVMMVTHYSILLVICQIIDHGIFQEPFSGIRTLAWFTISVIVEYPIVWFFNHKAKWMLGKR